MKNKKRLTNLEFIQKCKQINDLYKQDNEGKNVQPLFSKNFENFLDEVLEDIKDKNSENNPSVANTIINSHLKALK